MAKDLDKEVVDLKAKLDKEAKVSVKIPIDPMNKEDLYHVVVLNGCRYEIKKGERVEVPKSIADILEESNII